MKRNGRALSQLPPSRGLRLNQNSMQLAGLRGAWVFNEFAHSLSVRDMLDRNNGSLITAGSGFGWQPTDNEIGMGLYSPGGVSGNLALTDCGNEATLQVSTTGLTICIWLRMYQNLGGTSFPGVIGKGNSDSNSSGSYLMYIAGSPPKLNYFHWSGSARKNALTGATSLDFQRTYHLAATWRPSTRVSIFVNGLRDATTTTSVSATLDNPAYNLLFGSNQGNTGKGNYPFRGVVHEGRLYDRALSEDEIWQLWNPPTRWELYRAPQRFFGLSPAAAAGRVFGPAVQ